MTRVVRGPVDPRHEEWGDLVDDYFTRPPSQGEEAAVPWTAAALVLTLAAWVVTLVILWAMR